MNAPQPITPQFTEMNLQVRVRQSFGAYVTNLVHGKRASCTVCARSAVERLADKLFDDAWQTKCTLAAASNDHRAPELWTITATAKAAVTAGSPA